MGILSSMFNKMGHWHIRQLVRDCTKLIATSSMHEMNQKENPYLIDSTIDELIKKGRFRTMEGKKFVSLKEKFSEYIVIYVGRNLGRSIDSVSGEMGVLNEEIQKYWPVFMATKDGTQQKLKTENT